MKTREFWKVCKKLDNAERLDVLRCVMVAPEANGLPVGRISDMVRLGQPATSTYLAQLQSDCGLVVCEREGRYCLYRAEPDTSDERSTKLFHALRKYFKAECADWIYGNGRKPSDPPFMYVLPAFANAMRVDVLAFVRAAKRTDSPTIVAETGITRINVHRHLACLGSCGLVDITDGEVVWREPADELVRLLLKLSIT